jgi:hypothetical protein
MLKSRLTTSRWFRAAGVAAVTVVMLMAPCLAQAQAYWFESYQRAVWLIDEGRYEEATPVLETLLKERPYPEAQVRIPGNQFIDYLPYLHRARIQMHNVDFEGARKSLRVSEAFGAVKRNAKAMAELRDLQEEVRISLQASQRGSTGAGAGGSR